MKFKCPLCNFTANAITKLKTHFTLKHLRSGLKVCPVCGKTFDDTVRLRKHVLIKEDAKHMAYQYLFYSPKSKKFRGKRKSKLRLIAAEYFKVRGDVK